MRPPVPTTVCGTGTSFATASTSRRGGRRCSGLGDDEVGNTLLDWLNRVHPDEVEGSARRSARISPGETPHLEHEHRIQTAAGAYRWMLCRGIAVRDADGTGDARGRLADRRHRPARGAGASRARGASRLARRNLPEPRPRSCRSSDACCARSKRMGDYRYSVLFVDVDRFKLVNDSLGHLVGDQLLKAVAQQARQRAFAPATCSARLGGDEFTILLDGVNGAWRRGVCRRARAVALPRADEASTRGREIFVTTSIGIAMGGAHYEHPRSCCATPTPRCIARRRSARRATWSSSSGCATTRSPPQPRDRAAPRHRERRAQAGLPAGDLSLKNGAARRASRRCSAGNGRAAR